jgi:hypothetical protein
MDWWILMVMAIMSKVVKVRGAFMNCEEQMGGDDGDVGWINGELNKLEENFGEKYPDVMYKEFETYKLEELFGHPHIVMNGSFNRIYLCYCIVHEKCDKYDSKIAQEYCEKLKWNFC